MRVSGGQTAIQQQYITEQMSSKRKDVSSIKGLMATTMLAMPGSGNVNGVGFDRINNLEIRENTRKPNAARRKDVN